MAELPFVVRRAESRQSSEVIGSPPHRFRRFVSAEEIRANVHRLGRELSAKYDGQHPVLIGVLNGCFIFMADLIREMDIHFELAFVQLSSYKRAMASGQIDVLKETEISLTGRHVLIVEDIVDTGNSLKFLRNHLATKEPASLAMVSMFVKEGAARNGIVPEHEGIRIPDDFVVGYGLDFAGQWRQLPDLYVLIKE